MIITAENLSVEQRSGERSGTLTRLLNETQMHHRVSLFARVILKPGAKAPLHRHVGSFEAFYILQGDGLVNDDGNEINVKAGDVVFTDDGESHAIENIGQLDLEYIALVVASR